MRGMLHRVLEFHNSKRSSRRVGEVRGDKDAENHFTTETRRTRRTPSDVKLGHYPGQLELAFIIIPLQYSPKLAVLARTTPSML